jgi:hypothetical protein
MPWAVITNDPSLISFGGLLPFLTPSYRSNSKGVFFTGVDIVLVVEVDGELEVAGATFLAFEIISIRTKEGYALSSLVLRRVGQISLALPHNPYVLYLLHNELASKPQVFFSSFVSAVILKDLTYHYMPEKLYWLFLALDC